ncbi:MAG: hypothetical protein AB2708_15735, partial [Candidatus Thiodiazotropha taylori]
MKFIYLRGAVQGYDLSSRWLMPAVFLLCGLLFGVAMLWTGYQMGVSDTEFPEHQLVTSLENSFAKERQTLQDMKIDTQSGIDALAIRVGQIQSQLLRLDALGERLVTIGGLDKGEFSFEAVPALGGPKGISSMDQASALPDLLHEMEQLEAM